MSGSYRDDKVQISRNAQEAARGAGPAQEAGAPGAGAGAKEEVRINGFAQIVAMLEVADPDFRDSLLKRIAQRDPALARSLASDLTKNG